jgi:hypothetical protein
MLSSPEVVTRSDAQQELLNCYEDCAYFIDSFVQIYDPVSEGWLPFRLWGFQIDALDAIDGHPLTVILKARQLGLTWVALAYILWRMLFRPSAAALLFSRREDEARHLLERLTGMHARLPTWMQVEAVTSNSEVWALSNGSSARAFPSKGGDSYAATIVLADEFDLVENQGKLIRGAKPTIDAGGRMILLSRVDKDRPNTEFKNIYRAAREGTNPWHAIFLPWNVRPDRTPEWYSAQVSDSLTRTGSLDDLHEQYPATEEEALAPRSLNKRIAPAWLDQCYVKLPAVLSVEAPSIPGLAIYKPPRYGAEFICGADPAEGNPTSDDSAFTLIERQSGEEVATLAGKYEPAVFAANIKAVCGYFNRAPVMVERNNHGHTVLLWLSEHASELKLLSGHDDRVGWLSSSLGKTKLYDAAADAFRNRETIVHSMETYLQLAGIEGATLRAPQGERDDRADGYALALAGRVQPKGTGGQFNYLNGRTEED